MHFDKIHKQTLSEDIVEKIEEMITSGGLKPGDTLPPERELATMLGVSRPPLREALHSLKALGIVDINKNGAYLRDDVSIISDHMRAKTLLTQYTPQEVVEARIVLECETVSLACERANDNDIIFIREANAEAAKYASLDVDKFLNADFSFHIAIANASKNMVLAEMLRTIRFMFFAINELNALEPGHLETSVVYHNKIADAIEMHDQDLAKTIMKEHIEGFVSGVNMFLNN